MVTILTKVVYEAIPIATRNYTLVWMRMTAVITWGRGWIRLWVVAWGPGQGTLHCLGLKQKTYTFNGVSNKYLIESRVQATFRRPTNARGKCPTHMPLNIARNLRKSHANLTQIPRMCHANNVVRIASRARHSRRHIPNIVNTVGV
jgi:hypothetical protein